MNPMFESRMKGERSEGELSLVSRAKLCLKATH